MPISKKGNDETFSILRNYAYKKNLSDYSVEVTAFSRLMEHNQGKNFVDKKLNALEWVKNLNKETSIAMNNIHSIRTSGVERVEEQVEQQKLAVLHRINWVYNGSFKEKKYANAYPEVAFQIKTKATGGDKYWYEASYGIVKGINESNFGSYNYFLTLEEAIEFIREELYRTGQRALDRHYLKDHVRRHEEKAKRQLSKEDRAKLVREKNLARQKAKKDGQPDLIDIAIGKVYNKENIEQTFYNVRRASDIFTLNDFTRNMLVPYAYKQLEDARTYQRETERANQIIEESNIDLDKVETFHEDTINEQEDKPLASPQDIAKNINKNNETVIAKEKDNTSKNEVKDNNILDLGSGIVFDLDEIDENDKDNDKVSVLPHLQVNDHKDSDDSEEVIINDVKPNNEEKVSHTEYNVEVDDSPINETVNITEEISVPSVNIVESLNVEEELTVPSVNIEESSHVAEELTVEPQVHIEEHEETVLDIDIEEPSDISENIDIVDDIELSNDTDFDEYEDYTEELHAFNELITVEEGVVLNDKDLYEGFRDALPEMFNSTRLPIVEQEDDSLDSAMDDFLNDD